MRTQWCEHALSSPCSPPCPRESALGLFLSYSSQDRSAIEPLTTVLRRSREQVWFDEDLRGGEVWWNEIMEQIRSSEVFIAALSNHWLKSKPCQAELRYAQALLRPVLPVQIGRVDSIRANPLAALQVIDYQHPSADTDIQLATAVHTLAAQQRPLPSPLPDEPAVPFAYLIRLSSTLAEQQLDPRQQTHLLTELKSGLEEDGDDPTARNDIARLLRMLRDRSDVTYRTRTEIDDLLTSVDAKSPAPPDHRDITLTPPAPTTKYRPPGVLQSLVTRDRLMAILRAAGRRRLILIYAPSGYGKTTLTEQWRAELTSSGVAVGWLTVDDDDNNVVWFLAHVLEAIRRVRRAVAASLGQVLKQRGDEAVRYVLTSLIDEIDENGDPITLVIDDWQRVSDSPTIAALRFLIDHGSDHLQIIVNSWSRAQLPLSKLLLRDQLVEIDCEKLRFDADEAQSLLNDIAGLQLAGTDVTALTASTDGWIAGLQLARLSLRGGSNAGTLLSRMSGENEVVGEFLAENVLDALEPELAEFLLTTSITERTCGELASVLAGVSRGQTMLENAERRGLFLRRIDDDPQWFRYHQIFAGFLRRRLERDSPDRLTHLHRTASAWFADRGYLNQAVDHALAAGDATRAVHLVEQEVINLFQQSRVTAFQGIVEKLPPQLVDSSRLPLAIAWANAFLLRRPAAEAALERFTTAMSNANLRKSTRADLMAEVNVVRGIAEVLTDRVEAVADLVAEAMSRPDTLRSELPEAAANVSAFAAIYRFDLEGARQLLEWAAPYNEPVRPFGTVYTRCFAGIAARYQLDIPRALDSFRTAFEVGTAVGRDSHAAQLAGALLGELLYETGELAEAAHLLDDCYHFGPKAGGVDYLVARHVVCARIKAAQGDRDAAISRLAAGMAVAEELRLPRLAAAINHERVRLHLPIDPAEAARLRAARSVPYDGNGVATMTAELDAASGIRLLSRSHASDDREQACLRANALLAGIDPAARPLAALQTRLLLAETLTAAARVADAEDDIAVVRALCTQHGLSRLLIDGGLG
ncbi:MAG: TIR domain-containing protein [Mycobacterium sp.]